MFENKIVVEGFTMGGQLDFYEELLFNELGYPHGKCSINEQFWYFAKKDEDRYIDTDTEEWYQYYPKCADIDHDEIREWKEMCKERDYDPGQEEFLLDHSHIGIWRFGIFNKTGYDFGQQVIEFKHKEDLAYFVLKYLNSNDLVIPRRYTKAINKVMKGEEDVL